MKSRLLTEIPYGGCIGLVVWWHLLLAGSLIRAKLWRLTCLRIPPRLPPAREAIDKWDIMNPDAEGLRARYIAAPWWRLLPKPVLAK
jgi:hypothetical protein